MVQFTHPGTILREEYLSPSGLRAADLARATGLSTGRISEILNGKRAITAEIAYRLHLATRVSAQLWLGLQNDYDLHVIEKTKAAAIKKQTHAFDPALFEAAE